MQWNGVDGMAIKADDEPQFLDEFLGHDGVFLMRFVSWTAGPKITWELFRQLYTDFLLQKADAPQADICTAVKPSNFERETKM